MVSEKAAFNPEIPDCIQERNKKLERAVAKEMRLIVIYNQGFMYLSDEISAFSSAVSMCKITIRTQVR